MVWIPADIHTLIEGWFCVVLSVNVDTLYTTYIWSIIGFDRCYFSSKTCISIVYLLKLNDKWCEIDSFVPMSTCSKCYSLICLSLISRKGSFKHFVRGNLCRIVSCGNNVSCAIFLQVHISRWSMWSDRYVYIYSWSMGPCEYIHSWCNSSGMELVRGSGRVSGLWASRSLLLLLPGAGRQLSPGVAQISIAATVCRTQHGITRSVIVDSVVCSVVSDQNPVRLWQ